MNTPTTFQDHGFVMLFATIVIMAAIPNGYQFWQKIQKTQSDMNLKLTMLRTGSSADEIVRTLLCPQHSDSAAHRAK